MRLTTRVATCYLYFDPGGRSGFDRTDLNVRKLDQDHGGPLLQEPRGLFVIGRLAWARVRCRASPDCPLTPRSCDAA